MSGLGIRRCCCGYNVEKFDDTGTGSAPASLWRYQVGTSPQTTEGIRVDSSGNSYVMWLDGSQYKIEVINTSGVFVRSFNVDKITSSEVTISEANWGAWDVDSSGNVYTAFIDSGTLKVRKYNSSGTAQWTTSTLYTTSGYDLEMVTVACDRTGTAGVAVCSANQGVTGSGNYDLHFIDTSGTKQWEVRTGPAVVGAAFQMAGACGVNSSGDVFSTKGVGTSSSNPAGGCFDSTGTFQYAISTVAGSYVPMPLYSTDFGICRFVTKYQLAQSDGTTSNSFADSVGSSNMAADINSNGDWLYPYLSGGEWGIKRATKTGTNTWTIADGWKLLQVGPSDQLWATGEQK